MLAKQRDRLSTPLRERALRDGKLGVVPARLGVAEQIDHVPHGGSIPICLYLLTTVGEANAGIANFDSPERGPAVGRPSRLESRRLYGVGSAQEPPKMSVFPKPAGQSCSGAGTGALGPPTSENRKASIAGQSSALRTSFHTAAP